MHEWRNGKVPEGSAVPGTSALQVPRHCELRVFRCVEGLPERVLCIHWLFEDVGVDVGSRGKRCLVDPAKALQAVVSLFK